MFESYAGASVVQKLDADLFERDLNLAYSDGVAANRARKGLHVPNRSDRDTGLFRQLNLIDARQCACRPKLPSRNQAHLRKVAYSRKYTPSNQLLTTSLRLVIITSVLAEASNPKKEVAMATKAVQEKSVQIPAPKFGHAVFHIGGPVLVIHRFSAKVKQQMKEKMETGKAASSRRNREAKQTDQLYQEARYISKDGWDGFHAAALRNAMISACKLVGFKMTLAKLSIFVEADGYDEQEPQIPLIRIYGKPRKQEDMARVETGQPYVTVRAAYHDWKARVRIRWDEDQFTLADITNLLSRVGMQVGLCEGRFDSKNSAGLGWGSFEIERTGDLKAAA